MSLMSFEWEFCLLELRYATIGFNSIEKPYLEIAFFKKIWSVASAPTFALLQTAKLKTPSSTQKTSARSDNVKVVGKTYD
jgi:hypothetical protein